MRTLSSCGEIPIALIRPVDPPAKVWLTVGLLTPPSEELGKTWRFGPWASPGPGRPGPAGFQ